MKKKLLFLTFDPFVAEKHLTPEIKELIPVNRVLSVEELSENEMPDDFDYEGITYIFSTAGQEYHNCDNKERREKYNEDFISDWLISVSKDEYIEEYDDYCAEEEWMCCIIEYLNDFHEHIYVVEVELAEN